MVNELKLVVIHFTHQNPMQICACAWIYRWTKNYGKSGLGRRASEPPGPRSIAGPWAFRPPGRRGPWVAGLFLAKPPNMWPHSAVGRASHRYRGGHGFESRRSPDFFRLLYSNCLNWKFTAMIILHFDLHRSSNINYFIYTHQCI